MTRRVVYLRRAQRDLLDIVDYIRRDSEERAVRWFRDAQGQLSRLRSFPLSGVVPKARRLADRGYRMLILDEHLAFYIVRRNAVVIRRIIHGKRRYSDLL